MSDSLVQVERRGTFWFARLNRPAKRNALNESMIDQLLALCQCVDADAEARALVLWGAGASFCAGGDFDRFQALMAAPAPAGVDPIATHNRLYGLLLERIAALGVPTLGIVRGAAMGGGVGLACVMDRVIATDDAVFALPEVSLGLAPAQIAPFIARRIGHARARWHMLSSAKLDAAGALAEGLVDRVEAASTLGAAVTAELTLLACAEPTALRATKRLCLRNETLLVDTSRVTPMGAALDAAAADFAALLRAGAAQEGIAASRARRRPAWHVDVPDVPEFI